MEIKNCEVVLSLKKEREIEKEQEKTLQNIALNSKTLSNGTYYNNT